MHFARWVFALAGVYGLIVIIPLYFTESRIGQDTGVAITHAEYYYGFAGVALAWQVMFLLIAAEPARYRPIMLVGILEKLLFVVAVLCMLRSVPGSIKIAAAIDATWAVLFAVAFLRVRSGRGDALLFDRR
jgi:hypothetical protein